MPASQYRLFLNNDSATREQLDSIEEITVEQEVDRAWESHLKIHTSVDENGNWEGESEAFMEPFSRIRVEIKVGQGSFVALIDGPIVGYDTVKSSEPGQSSITLIVQDDSVYLNREETLEHFSGQLDHEIAGELFGRIEQITITNLPQEGQVASAADSLPLEVVQRGTAMQLLRTLARRQGFHVYVLPGDEPGESVGYFGDFPTEPSDLPPLVLLGLERNIESFNISSDEQRPVQTQTFSLNFTDRAVVSSRSSFRDLDLLGEEHTFTNEDNTSIQLARPSTGGVIDADRLADADTKRSSYSFEASGSVIADCYPGVLRPYQTILVKGVNSPLSGNYSIYKVTHTLTRSSYEQSFVVKRNARSSEANEFNNLKKGVF